MLFLINNPVIAFALLVVIGFTVFMVSKVIEEIKLNQLLSIKHQQMRVKDVAKKFRFRLAGLTSATLAPIALVAIMVVTGLNPSISPNGDMVSIHSANDIRQIYLDFSEKLNINYSGNIFTPNVFVDGMEMDMITEKSSPVPTYNSGTGSDDYSTTNTQVIGVDEMDNVLTDGKFIYSIYENKVQISIAYTLEEGPSVLSLYKTFDYSTDACSGEQFYPSGLYVDEDRLIVIGDQYLYNCEYYSGEPSVDGDGIMIDRYMPYWYSQSSHIKVLVFDKANDFTLEDEYRMNGYFTGTRKIDNDLYIVTNNYIPLNDEDSNIDDYLSTYSVNGVEEKVKYEDIIYIEGTTPNSFTTFYGINLDTKEVDVETILGDSGYNLYVSNDNMYLVGEVYYFWPIANMIRVEDPVYDYKTAILKIAIDNGTVEFSNFGKISGHPLDQFAMDEYEGNLRITTTTGWWGESINNRLYVLNKDLEVVSVLENLGKVGERIQSTRFVGEYAYLVTFLQTDPFYVINLSDSENPFVEGELEIPGFSSYLQPLNENFMLGIG
ncbi:MAG: beta-propeller domain-containing protein, partial [Bacilli bacterium]|nr:beta-propeller domain-containing protein [Bacilli bacterium]